MKNYNLIKDIFSAPWMLEPGRANALLPVVAGILKGNDEVLTESNLINKREVVFAISGSIKSSSVISNSKPTAESVVAIIPVKDVITKYDVSCGPKGTETIANWIKQADADNQVAAIILDIDSPGGAGNATQYISDVIKQANKPVIAYVGNGLAASAAYWIASACKEIYATYDTDEIGSIGTYITIADFNGYFEKEGLKIHEVYASKSTEKNIEFRDALKGDYKALQKNLLDPFNESFISAVKANRQGIKEEVFTGKIFFAKEALQMGLIDGIKSFNDVIARAFELSESNQSTNDTNNKNNMSLFGKKSAITALISASLTERTPEMLDAANAELKAAGIEGAIVSNEEIASLKAAVKTEQDAHAVTKTDLQNANDRVSALEAICAENKLPIKKGDDSITNNVKTYSETDEEYKKIYGYYPGENKK